MALTKDDTGALILGETCTLAELGEWIRSGVDSAGALWSDAVAGTEIQADIAKIIEESEAQQTLGMEWTNERAALLIFFADKIAEQYGHSESTVDSFVRITMMALAGYPEVLQDVIEINLKTAEMRLADGVEVLRAEENS